jgi:hypothetical protein
VVVLREVERQGAAGVAAGGLDARDRLGAVDVPERQVVEVGGHGPRRHGVRDPHRQLALAAAGRGPVDQQVAEQHGGASVRRPARPQLAGEEPQDAGDVLGVGAPGPQPVGARRQAQALGLQPGQRRHVEGPGGRGHREDRLLDGAPDAPDHRDAARRQVGREVLPEGRVVVVAGHGHDWRDLGERLHRGEAGPQAGGVDQPPVEQVARHEHRVGALGGGDVADLGQDRRRLGHPVEAVEPLADVPVGGVEDPHRDP